MLGDDIAKVRTAAGRRSLAEARRLRIEQRRAFGWRYVPGVLAYCAMSSLFIVWLAWTSGASAAWFGCGLAVGASLLLLWITVDSVAASRYEMAGLAEQWTEEAVRSLRRAGWTVASNIPFEHCDVDHVAFGPAGVVVLETKWTDGALFRRDRLSQYGMFALDQAESGGDKIGRVLAQSGYSGHVDGCLVVVWGKRVPGGHIRISGRRASVIDGRQLADFLASKPARLSTAEARQASDALNAWLTPRLARIATAANS